LLVVVRGGHTRRPGDDGYPVSDRSIGEQPCAVVLVDPHPAVAASDEYEIGVAVAVEVGKRCTVAERV
jgi:hypothetical protein